MTICLSKHCGDLFGYPVSYQEQSFSQHSVVFIEQVQRLWNCVIGIVYKGEQDTVPIAQQASMEANSIAFRSLLLAISKPSPYQTNKNRVGSQDERSFCFLLCEKNSFKER